MAYINGGDFGDAQPLTNTDWLVLAINDEHNPEDALLLEGVYFDPHTRHLGPGAACATDVQMIRTDLLYPRDYNLPFAQIKTWVGNQMRRWTNEVGYVWIVSVRKTDGTPGKHRPVVQVSPTVGGLALFLTISKEPYNGRLQIPRPNTAAAFQWSTGSLYGYITKRLHGMARPPARQAIAQFSPNWVDRMRSDLLSYYAM